jgi:hypothetical protein
MPEKLLLTVTVADPAFSAQRAMSAIEVTEGVSLTNSGLLTLLRMPETT